MLGIAVQADRQGNGSLDPRPNLEEGSGNNRAWKCLAGMPRFLNSANFPLSDLQCDWSGTTISKFQCSTIYLLPVVSLSQTLVGWSDVLSLINTDGSILSLKTLPGKVFPQTLPRGLGLGSRLRQWWFGPYRQEVCRQPWCLGWCIHVVSQARCFWGRGMYDNFDVSEAQGSEEFKMVPRGKFHTKIWGRNAITATILLYYVWSARNGYCLCHLLVMVDQTLMLPSIFWQHPQKPVCGGQTLARIWHARLSVAHGWVSLQWQGKAVTQKDMFPSYTHRIQAQLYMYVLAQEAIVSSCGGLMWTNHLGTQLDMHQLSKWHCPLAKIAPSQPLPRANIEHNLQGPYLGWWEISTAL